MGIKLLLVLLILGIHVSEGGKLIKKLTKELKKIIKGMKFDDFIAHTIEEVEGLKEDVSNNSATIRHNSEKIHRVADKVEYNVASIHMNAKDIAFHNPSEWLMVATGNVGTMANPSNVVETINMKISKSCHSLPLYPHEIKMANGMMIHNVPIIAGGNGKSGPISEVYYLDFLSNSWVMLGNMAEKRNQFAVAELDGGVWAMGGFSQKGQGLWSSMQSSTEIIYTDGTILNGPELPEARARHCAVNLPNGKIVIMGGRTSQNDPESKDVLIYDPSTSNYTSGPQMIYGHEMFACVHFYSDKHGGRPVILSAGGSSNSKAEIYDYVNGHWEEIPDIPSPYAPSSSSTGGPRAVPSLDGKGAILQHGENFFELTCDTSSCTWSVMGQTLDVGRTGGVMMYLPSTFECDRGCEDNSHVKGLLNIGAPEDIVGWHTTCTHGNIYGTSAGSTCPNLHFYASGTHTCFIKTTLHGSGHAKIDFGNCFNDGVSKLFLDGIEIASAGASQATVVKEFDYTDGAELKLTEEGSGVISFNFFKVLTC